MIGIYKITNTVNGKVYIGQSWDIERRWNSEKRGSTNEHLKSAFKKYGVKNFTFEVEYKMEEDSDQKDLDEFERFYIGKYRSHDREYGYNQTHGGNGGKKTEEFKKKISENKERAIKISKALKGKKFTDKHYNSYLKSHWAFDENRRNEVAKKISNGSKGKVLSKEHKRKISESTYNPVICLETKEIFRNMKQAMYKHGRTVRHQLEGRTLISKKGYTFRYFDKGGTQDF